MTFIEAIKSVARRVVANILAATERLSSQEVIVSENGDIVIREPVVKTVADKLSAVVIVAAALFFLLSPIQGKTAMAIGDQLMRAATMLWSGATPTFAT